MKTLFLRLVSGSVRRHLVIGVALVHAVMMAVYVYDITQRERASLHQQAVDQSRSLADILAVDSVSRVLTGDLVGLQETVDGVSAYPDIRHVMVVDPGGRVLAHSDRKVVGLYLSDSASRRMLGASPHALLLQSTATVSDAAAPVVAAGRLVGWARVGLNLETIAAAQAHIVRRGIVYALIAIAVGSLLALFIGRHLTRGLNALEQVAEKVKAGERGLRAEVVDQDEVGRLAEDFNDMLNALELREAELDASRAQLAQSEERFALPEIDRWVIHNALRTIAETRTQAHVSLAINLSGLSLLDATLPAYIREQLRLTGVDPARLCFEITETAARYRQA